METLKKKFLTTWHAIPPLQKFIAGMVVLVLLVFIPLPLWLALPLVLLAMATAGWGGYEYLRHGLQPDDTLRIDPSDYETTRTKASATTEGEEYDEWEDDAEEEW